MTFSRLIRPFEPGLFPLFRVSPEWAECNLSWRHTGFNVHSRVRAKTRVDAERVGKYMIWPVLSLERLSLDEKHGQVCNRIINHLKLTFVADKPPPALRAPIYGAIDGAARPAAVFHHHQEGIFIAWNGYSSRRGKRKIL